MVWSELIIKLITQFNWYHNSISYSNPHRNWVYLNIDGSDRSEVDFVSTGGIVRDKVGNWIFGFNRFLGSCSMFKVELWGILDGLDILINRDYDNVLV